MSHGEVNEGKAIETSVMSNLDGSNNNKMLAQAGKRLSVDSCLMGPPMDPSYQPKILRQCSSSAKTLDDLDQEYEPNPFSKILVLYTGGTIGMKSKGGGTVKH